VIITIAHPVVPLLQNLRGGSGRPDPYDLWLNLYSEIANNRALHENEEQFESYKYSRDFLSQLPKTIHYGNTITASGFHPTFKPHQLERVETMSFDFSDSDSGEDQLSSDVSSSE
jgi:hypothetical protein